MDNKNKTVEMRDKFIKVVDSMNYIISLCDKEINGEEVSDNEIEMAMGKFMVTMMELQR